MTKFCPHCHTEVPEYAKTCKQCFHDFTPPPAKGIPLGLSIGLFLLSIAAYFGTAHLASSQVIHRYNLFPEAQSLLIVSSSKDGIHSDRIPFSQIDHLEHIQGGELNPFEIVAVIQGGERILLQGSDKSLATQAQDMARKTDLILKSENKQQGL